MIRFIFSQKDDEDQLIYEEDDWTFEDEAVHQKQEASLEPVVKDVESAMTDEELFLEYDSFDTYENTAHIWNLETKIGLFAVILVLIDVTLVIVALSMSSDNIIYSGTTIAIVSYFMVELSLRIFAWGKEFFHHRLEVVDMIIIISTFVMTLVFELIVINQHLKFGKLLVIFRLLRVVLLVRIFLGKKHVEKATRNLISQNKRRYVKDGFDLDLTYITDKIIAMSFPSSGTTSMYRNPIEEVVRFFNTKHSGHYKIYNLCSERSYEGALFNGPVERVMIDDHNVPPLSVLLKFCQSVDEWMKRDKENVVAIHCKGGKGRTGMCIAAWMVYSGQFKSADKALDHFGTRRTDREKGRRYQGVETPSQSRYVRYLEKIVHEMDGKLPPSQSRMIKSIKIIGQKSVGKGNGTDLSMTMHVNNKLLYELDCANPPSDVEIKKVGDALKIKFDIRTCQILSGDVKIRFLSSSSNVPKDYDDCSYFFCFHTSFLHNNKLHLSRSEIGNPHKEKHWKIYPEKFSIVVKSSSPT